MWAQIFSAIIGLAVMASSGIFGYNGIAADNEHIIGPILVTFAVTSWWEATRNVRKFNRPFALWLLIAPWVLGYEELTPMIVEMVCGVLIFGLSFVRGKIEQNYGGGWRALWESNSLHEKIAIKRKEEAVRGK